MRVVVHRRNEELFELEAAWNRLVDADDALTSYQRYEWIFGWWQVFSQAHQLYVLSVWQHDELVGIAPLMRTRFFIGLHGLRFMADDISDYCQIISRSGDQKRVMREIMIFLLQHPQDWHYLQMKELPEKTLEPLIAGSDDTDVLVKTKPLSRTYIIPITSSWEEYLHKLSARMRKKFTVPSSLLTQFHLGVYSGQEITPKILDDMIDLNRRSPEVKQAGSIFLHSPYREFHVKHLFNSSFKQYITVVLLYLGNKLAAYNYNFRFKQRLLVYNCNFAEAFSRLSVGTFSMMQNIKYAFDSQLTCCDFLRGDYLFKKRFNTVEQQNYEMLIFRRRFFYSVYCVANWVFASARGFYTHTFLPAKKSLHRWIQGGIRAKRYLQQKGLKPVFLNAWETVRSSMFFFGSVYVMRFYRQGDLALQSITPLPAGMTCREISIRDYDSLETFFGFRHVGKIMDRLMSGDRCWGILLADKLVGYAWLTQSFQMDQQFGIRVNVNPGEVFIYDAQIAVPWRRQGLMRHILQAVLTGNTFAQMSSFFSLVEKRNTPMLGLMRQLGFYPEKRIDCLRIGSLINRQATRPSVRE